MKNTQNNQIHKVFSVLGILAIFAIALFFSPTHVTADNSGSVTPYGATAYPYVANTGQSFTPGGSDTPNTYTAPAQTRVVTRTVYVNNPAPANTTSNNYNNSTDNTNTSNTDTSSDGSNLASSVILGSGGFLPSGIVGWILFAILILIIVILVRKVTGGAKRYHETPLKHA